MKTIDAILHSPSVLHTLIRKCQTTQRLGHLVQLALDPVLRTHCTLACYEENILTLIVPHAAWATKLRYQSTELLVRLRTFPEFAMLQTINCRIRPMHDPVVLPPTPALMLSPQNETLWRETMRLLRTMKPPKYSVSTLPNPSQSTVSHKRLPNHYRKLWQQTLQRLQQCSHLAPEVQIPHPQRPTKTHNPRLSIPPAQRKLWQQTLAALQSKPSTRLTDLIFTVRSDAV